MSSFCPFDPHPFCKCRSTKACIQCTMTYHISHIFNKNEIIGVLDVDSEYLSHFDEIDAKYLKEIVSLIDA